MNKLINLSLLISSVFAFDYQMGGGVGVGNGYKFMNLRMQKYLTDQNTIRFEMEKTTKNDDSISTKGMVGLSQDLNIDIKDLKTYAFTSVGYQLQTKKKNGIIADLGVGTSYNLNNNLSTFLELRTLRDFKNNDTHYGVLAGILYKFTPLINDENEVSLTSSKYEDLNEEKVYKPVAPLAAQNINISNTKKTVKKLTQKIPKISTRNRINISKIKKVKLVEEDKNIKYINKPTVISKKVVISKKNVLVNNSNKFKFIMHFDRNSKYIKESDMQHLIEFAEFLQTHSNVKAEIQGYTDNVGSEKNNQYLSEEKAKLVYNILIDLGVNKNQLSYKGFGSNSTSNIDQANIVIAKLYS